jgi:hypothetical protein
VRPPCHCRLGSSSPRRRLVLPARRQDRDAAGRGRPPGRRPGRRRRTRASRYPPPGSMCGPLCLRGRGPGRPTGRARGGRGEAAGQRCQERRPSGVSTVILLGGLPTRSSPSTLCPNHRVHHLNVSIRTRENGEWAWQCGASSQSAWRWTRRRSSASRQVSRNGIVGVLQYILRNLSYFTSTKVILHRYSFQCKITP